MEDKYEIVTYDRLLNEVKQNCDQELVEITKAIKLIADINYLTVKITSAVIDNNIEDLGEYIRVLEKKAKKAFKDEKHALKLDKLNEKIIKRLKKEIVYYEGKLKSEGVLEPKGFFH